MSSFQLTRFSRTVLFAAVLSVGTLAARAETIVIPFSGSGSSGTLAPGLPWNVLPAPNLHGFGSPFVGSGASPGAFATWPGPGGIDDFTITFTAFSSGVTIDPSTLTIGCAGGSVALTAFCSTTPLGAGFVEHPWTPVLSNGNDTITFTAPAGVSLNAGNTYFTNIFFTAPQESVTFTGGWSSEQGAIPEPSPITLLSTLIGLVAIGVWRARRRQTAD